MQLISSEIERNSLDLGKSQVQKKMKTCQINTLLQLSEFLPLVRRFQFRPNHEHQSVILSGTGTNNAT